MGRTVAGAALVAGVLAWPGVAVAHTLPIAGAKRLAERLETKQRHDRHVINQTLTEGRRVSPHRVVFHYTDSNADDSFACGADIVVKYLNAHTTKAVAYFSHVRCGAPD